MIGLDDKVCCMICRFVVGGESSGTYITLAHGILALLLLLGLPIALALPCVQMLEVARNSDTAESPGHTSTLVSSR